MRIILFIIFCSLFTSAFAEDIYLPKEWRFATSDELQSFRNWRNSSPSKYTEASADFNNDGKIDYAYLVKSTNFSGQGLLVKLSEGDGYQWLVLDKINWGKKHPKVKLSMGIELFTPGVYRIVCGSEENNCENDGKRPMTFKYPSISYFRFASSGSVFVWNEKLNKFDRFWDSH